MVESADLSNKRISAAINGIIGPKKRAENKWNRVQHFLFPGNELQRNKAAAFSHALWIIILLLCWLYTIIHEFNTQIKQDDTGLVDWQWLQTEIVIIVLIHHLWILIWTDIGETRGTGNAPVPVWLGYCWHPHHTCPHVVQKVSRFLSFYSAVLLFICSYFMGSPSN